MTHNCSLIGQLALKPGAQFHQVELAMENFMRTIGQDFHLCLGDQSIRIHQEPNGLRLVLFLENVQAVGGETNPLVDELCSQLGPMVHPAGWLRLTDHKACTAESFETMYFVGADAQALAAAQLVYAFQEYVGWAKDLMETQELSVVSHLTAAVQKARDLDASDTLRTVKSAQEIAETVLGGLPQSALLELIQHVKNESPDSIELALKSCALA